MFAAHGASQARSLGAPAPLALKSGGSDVAERGACGLLLVLRR
jgi:hypothetical protein